MKANSCKTCALMVSLTQSDAINTIRTEEIYAEFLRRNKASNRIIDIGGSDAKTVFCALGSRHFKKGGLNCRHWIPDIGLSISDAIAINLNRKILCLTAVIVFFTVFSVVGIFMPSKTPQPIQQPSKITTQILPPLQNNNGQHLTESKVKGNAINENEKIKKPILKDKIIKQGKDEIPQK